MKDKTLIVIDWETLGVNTESCPVMALGIVIGNTEGRIFGKREFIFNLSEQFNLMNAYAEYKGNDNTVEWWSSSEREALFKDYLYRCMKQTLPIATTMRQVNNFMFASYDIHNSLIVANHTDFDVDILIRMYEYADLHYPFTFRDRFDTSDINMFMQFHPDYSKLQNKEADSLVKHRAIDDAMYSYLELVNQIEIVSIPF